ncbi:uncharacterized protein LOC117193249 [Drosophila miranda]|uniref:uncharacterized protein LOC117193249 n=1 Tax=Drosophila miranda TaxID=7229 RepID=UPI00143F4793|nr:uncharacterized protein LOC117193249 [Drosophila miranda]
MDERAALEAKIKKLMEHCAIREIAQPKVKRNFVSEAIGRTYVPPPNKRPDHIKAKPKPKDKFPTRMELVHVPKPIRGPSFAERTRQKFQAELQSEKWKYPLLEPIKPVKIRRYSEPLRLPSPEWVVKFLEVTLEAPPKPAYERGAGDSPAADGGHCTICDQLEKNKREPDSPLIKRLKAQSRRLELRAYYRLMMLRERQKNLQATPVAPFPEGTTPLPAQKADCF